MDGNGTKGKIFMYLFWQPFIFWHLHYFAGFPISELIVFDIALLCILFWFFEKWIFFAFIVYYSIYFYFFDNFPHLFSQEDQERDFYMDIYKLGTSLLISMDALEEDMTDAKNGIIHKSLWINLSNTIQTIENLSTLIEEKSFLLGGKEKFQQFLIGMLNEILIVYSYIFDSLTEQILSIESDVNTDHLDNAQKQYLSNIIKPILENKREQLQNMKQLLLSKVIT